MKPSKNEDLTASTKSKKRNTSISTSSQSIPTQAAKASKPTASKPLKTSTTSKTNKQSRAKSNPTSTDPHSSSFDKPSSSYVPDETPISAPQLLSVRNRTINFGSFEKDEEVSLLQLGKAWVENNPAEVHRKRKSQADDKIMVAPPLLEKKRELPQPLVQPKRRRLERVEQLRALNDVAECVFLACHVSSFQRQRKLLFDERFNEYERYRERLRMLNLAVPRRPSGSRKHLDRE